MDVSNITHNSYYYSVDSRIFIIVVENCLHYPQEADSAPLGKNMGLFKENRGTSLVVQ